MHSEKVTRVAGGFVVRTQNEMRHLHIFVNGCYYGVNNAVSSAENQNNPPECVSSSVMWCEDFKKCLYKRGRICGSLRSFLILDLIVKLGCKKNSEADVDI